MKRLVILLGLICSQALSAAEVKIASLDWPPFAGANLPEGGAAIAVLRDLLKQKGHTLKVDYMNWDDAVKQTKEKKYQGIYPSWPNDVPKADGWEHTPTIFKSPIVFVFPKKKFVSWNKIEDFVGKKMTLGAVKAYGYSPALRAKMDPKKPEIPFKEYDDDYKLMEGMMKGEVDFAVYDMNVAKYVLAKIAKDKAKDFQINGKFIAELDLLVGVPKGSDESLKLFSSVVTGLNTKKMLTDYFFKYPM